jgi:hypothetical protein
MSSIDRKIARCAREIEAAKPKSLSLDDFRFLNHDIKGVAQAEPARAETPRTPAAAPPSAKSRFAEAVALCLSAEVDGWAEHQGGEAPIGCESGYEILYADGGVGLVHAHQPALHHALRAFWTHESSLLDGHIVAYRVLA